MNFKTSQFNTVVEKALALAVGNIKWHRAIERAAEGLRAGNIIVTELASGCLVTTENASYKVDHKCECSAFQHGHKQCKHRAARRLCALYSEATIEEKAATARIVSEVETRTIEYDRTGASYVVTRCGGWAI